MYNTITIIDIYHIMYSVVLYQLGNYIRTFKISSVSHDNGKVFELTQRRHFRLLRRRFCHFNGICNIILVTIQNSVDTRLCV